MSVIKTERINKIYKTKAERIVAVREVSIDIRAGEFVGIIGSSGSGMVGNFCQIGVPTWSEWKCETTAQSTSAPLGLTRRT